MAFSRILIPVDFTVNTEIALNRAISLIEPTNSSIWLVHIIRASNRITPESRYHSSEVERKINDLAFDMMERLPDVSVRVIIETSRSIHGAIIGQVAVIQPDLIIIGRNRKKGWPFRKARTSSGLLALECKCPVLTAKPGSMNNRIRNIVIPLHTFISQLRLELAINIAKMFKAKIHLVTIPDFKNLHEYDPASIFIESFYKLNQALPTKISYGSLKGTHLPKATLDFARAIDADLIIAELGEESNITFFNGFKHLSEMLNNDSRLEIMDVPN